MHYYGWSKNKKATISFFAWVDIIVRCIKNIYLKFQKKIRVFSSNNFLFAFPPIGGEGKHVMDHPNKKISISNANTF